VVKDGLPIVFEPAPSQSQGQIQKSVTMIARLPGATVAFKPGTVLMDLPGKQPSRLEIGFTGASSAIPQGSFLEQSQTNYLLGNDPGLWRTHVPNYRRVVYSGLYPGIDAVFYGSGQLLEHDFISLPVRTTGKSAFTFRRLAGRRWQAMVR
jgi:hypothetical protein